MNGLIESTFNGKTIRRNQDSWFNLGDIAEAGGKDRSYASKWVDGPGVEYIQLALERIPDGILSRSNGPGGGIWAHYKIARRFAQAVSAEIAWHVDEIVEGKITVAPPAEQAEAQLIRSLTAIADRVESLPRIEADVVEVKSELVSVKQDVAELKQAAKSHRKPFGKRTMDAAMACIDDKYNRGGKLVCPCCETPATEFEFHHWEGKGGNDSKYCLPLRPECHQQAESDPDWHDLKRSEYNVFRKLATQYYRAAGLIAGKQKVQVQPTLFGEVEDEQ